uniref:Uncharacterized protein n=1 Tax=Pristionchus pacificus TaxID=54126 RepID=A0A2A6CWV1_PRIPA|eukprot:PDM82527.1 hypothetical protein PRIPAC_36920 [Pristionchus pacificus]
MLLIPRQLRACPEGFLRVGAWCHAMVKSRNGFTFTKPHYGLGKTQKNSNSKHIEIHQKDTLETNRRSKTF